MHRMFRRKPFLVLGLPLAVATLTSGLLFGALFLSAAKSDEAANKRQQDLLKLVVTKLEAEVAHNQESATVWDDAVVEVRQRNEDWIASNLGEWMHSYFQHDAALVLDNAGNPIYEFVAETVSISFWCKHCQNRGPLVYKLQKRLAAGEISTGTTVLSLGESDLLDLNGRAAIFSLKPIISDSGEIEQESGSQISIWRCAIWTEYFFQDWRRTISFKSFPSFANRQAVRIIPTSRCVLHLGTRLVTFSGNRLAREPA